MFEEFKKAYGINDSYNNFNRYQDLFVDWIAKKRYAARGYVKLFSNYILQQNQKSIFCKANSLFPCNSILLFLP